MITEAWEPGDPVDISHEVGLKYPTYQGDPKPPLEPMRPIDSWAKNPRVGCPKDSD